MCFFLSKNKYRLYTLLFKPLKIKILAKNIFKSDNKMLAKDKIVNIQSINVGVGSPPDELICRH